MLAAENGHEDLILFLIQRGATNLDLVNAVSAHEHMLYYKARAS